MYNRTRIEAAGVSLVGIRQDANAIYSGLSAALKLSSSGYYVNDLPGVTLEIISSCLQKDQTVSTYLTNCFSTAIIDLVDRFVNRVKSELNQKELLGSTTIVKGVASFNDKVTQNARAVGFWIRSHRGNGLKIHLKQLGFQAALQANPVRVFLYETSQIAPIKTFDFTIGTSNSLIWRDVTDFIIYHQSLAGGSGQDYLVLYYEHDPLIDKTYQLKGQALSMMFDGGCQSCGGAQKSIYGKYMSVMPVEFNNSVLNYNATSGNYDIPLVNDVANYVTNQTYGLNAKVNVSCDVTDTLVQNISMFARAIQHSVAVRILYDAYATTEINSIADSKRSDIKAFAAKYDGILNGYNTPEGQRIKGLIDTLTIDFSDLDKFCLPCKHEGVTQNRLTRRPD